jgi:hypothetical protein
MLNPLAGKFASGWKVNVDSTAQQNNFVIPAFEAFSLLKIKSPSQPKGFLFCGLNSNIRTNPSVTHTHTRTHARTHARAHTHTHTQNCKREIYHYHYAISSYHSNDFFNVNTFYERKLCNERATSLFSVYKCLLIIFHMDMRKVESSRLEDGRNADDLANRQTCMITN